MIKTLRDALKRLWAEDRAVGWMLVAFAVLQLIAACWDLPGSHGWDNDGIAPRDLFGGLAFNLTPGKGHRYPLLHYLVVTIGSLPFLIVGAIQATGWTLKELMETILSPFVMTGVSLVARIAAICMTSISIATLARIARRIFSTNAGRWAALFAMFNLSIGYYGRVSNLDAPYMMWIVLAIYQLFNVAERGEMRDYLWFAFFTGAAVATKDQAYASFVFVGLGYLFALTVLAPKHFVAQGTDHWKRFAAACGAGFVTLGVLGGGFINPTGWLKRFKTMTGPASQDWKTYEGSWEGLVSNVGDIAVSQSAYWWPWPVVVLGWLGVVWAVFAKEGEQPTQRRIWRVLPAVALVSSLVCFTLVVGRNGPRFVLPAAFWLSLYAGVLVDVIAQRVVPERRRWVHVAAGALVVWSVAHVSNLYMTQWCDPRWDVTEYLETLPKGSTVETYGLVVYQPHYNTSPEAPYRVLRVGKKAVKKRNPVYGSEEIVANFDSIEERKPDAIVIPYEYGKRYVMTDRGPDGKGEGGRKYSKIIQRYQAQKDGNAFFEAAFGDALPNYRVVMIAQPKLPSWFTALGGSVKKIHNSTGPTVWVLRRVETP